MRQPALGLAVLLLGCSPHDLAGIQPHRGLHEVRHVVEVRFENGAALLKVQRELRNDGSHVTWVIDHDLPVPEGAVATSLRLGRNGEVPAAGTLATVEDVADRWAALTGPGEAAPTPIGRLEWALDGMLSLELFALSPGESVTIAYDLLVPPTYEGGQLAFLMPREELAEGWLAPHFEGAAVEETDEGFLLSRQHHTDAIADIRWGTSQLDSDRTLWRLEVDAAMEFEPAPVAPNVVFVVDASHSQGRGGVTGQLELMKAYLLNTPDARVEVVLTRRNAERLWGRFVAATDVPALLAQVNAERLASGNGSNLELGAGLAAQSLASVGGTSRVVIFTDEAMRWDFSNDQAIAALAQAPVGTVAHVVGRWGRSTGPLSEHRDDEAALSPIAVATGGVFFRLGGEVGDPYVAARTLLGLVRPIRVDDFTVERSGVEDLLAHAQLDEGSMVRLEGIGVAPSDRITVTGKIWAREFRREISSNDALARRLPALAVGSSALRSQLSDDELRTAAFLAQAVSPVTSFFYAPATAAPSGEALSLGLHGYGVGSSRCGGYARVTTRCGMSVANVADHTQLLRGLLGPGVTACERELGETAEGLIAIEATQDEIVAVHVSGARPSMARCLAEASWSIRLTEEFIGHRDYRLALTAR